MPDTPRMTIEDIERDIRSSAVRLVPVEASERLQKLYESADWCVKKGRSVDPRWLLDEISAVQAFFSPDHTAAVVALIEERDRLRAEQSAIAKALAWSAPYQASLATRAEALLSRTENAEARALAAEAERDALREALAPFGCGAVVFYENEPDDCVLSLGRWKYQEDGRARFYADVQFTVADVRRARALSQETDNVGE